MAIWAFWGLGISTPKTHWSEAALLTLCGAYR